ncbi:MAG: carbamoyl phosphate synthase small subunit, partial [Clostridia bacterium]
NGSLYEGVHRGAEGVAVGEVIFHTSVAGYQDVLTNPIYLGQMVCMTYPLIGGYGMTCENGETDKAWLSGLIVNRLCDTPSNWRSKETVDEYLVRTGTVAITNIDTRMLTRCLRDSGTQNGVIYTEDCKLTRDELMNKLSTFAVKDATKKVLDGAETVHVAGDGPRVAVVSFGAPGAIKGGLARRGADVTVIPATQITADELLSFDAVAYSDGAGDPCENAQAVEILKEIIAAKKPFFGAGMGLSLLTLAAGGKLVRLTHGHHGGNYPSVDTKKGRTYMTNQSHVYTTDAASLDDKNVRISHTNLNDKSVEGIELINAPASAVSFVPEGFPGPHDTMYLLDDFMTKIRGNK